MIMERVKDSYETSQQPLVSVIIPNYNHARYLDQRITTVLNQTYKNFEVIILDDCSTDNSLEVIDKYKDNPHISRIVVNEVNTGSPFKQWDKGIHLSKGEVIWIAESDDYCELNLLEELVKAMTARKGIVLAYPQYVFDYDGYMLANKEHKTRYYRGSLFVRRRQARRNYIVNASGVIFRKKAYDTVPYDYVNFRADGDFLFWSAVLKSGDVVHVGRNLSFFRKTGSSVTDFNSVIGVNSREEEKIFNYINATFHLDRIERYLAKLARARFYQTIQFESDDIRREILTIFGIKQGYGLNPIFNFIFWMTEAFERHFGYLL